jgi:ATP-dependent protease ClpP protease subunit
MKKSKTKSYDGIELWLDANVDTTTRTIYIGSMTASIDMQESGVDNFMAESVIKAIHVLENISNEPIVFIMNNPGGSWYHGMAIYDAIAYSSCPTIIRAFGHAMSMGSIIMQAADYRIMMPNAKFMIHYGYDGFYGHSKTSQKWADEGKKISRQMEDIYITALISHEEKIGVKALQDNLSDVINFRNSFEFPTPNNVQIILPETLEERIEKYREILKDLLNTDTVLNAQETVMLGFADEVFTNIGKYFISKS